MNKPIRVVFKQGARQPVKAETAFNELERIRGAHDGALLPATIVEESRPEDAPLHKVFEWDDDIAAQKYREDQARTLVRSIEVVRKEAPSIQSRAYEISAVRLGSGEEGDTARVYRAVEDILADPLAKEQLMADAMRDAKAFQKRYGALHELEEVFDAINKLAG